ncbi:aldo/keto reductase [Nocardia fusca]|uniref:Aldo/keto reductase n=1 Tax=Nocardia fusca TaxID=941183 RepID=A0ABV3F1F4_9NOCA
MRTRPLGRTGIQVSAYCLGTMMFGPAGNPDRAQCVRIVHRALDAGIDFVDTADGYGPGGISEERKLDAVEELVPPAAEAGLSPAYSAMSFAVTHPGITSAIVGPRTPALLDDLLAGAAVTLDDEVLDRIDRIVAPGTDLGPLDVAYVPPAVELPALRRRPAAERAAA